MCYSSHPKDTLHPDIRESTQPPKKRNGDPPYPIPTGQPIPGKPETLSARSQEASHSENLFSENKNRFCQSNLEEQRKK